MDATIYAIVLHPALHELLHTSNGPPTTEHIGWYGGIIFSIFLDRLGHRRDYVWSPGGPLWTHKVLIATILIYAVFTGAAALSQEWWHLAIYRFLTALGIGGEWAAGAALVAETWPEDETGQSGRNSPVRLGCGIFSGGPLQSCPERRVWMAGSFPRRHLAGLRRLTHPVVGQGAASAGRMPMHSESSHCRPFLKAI